MTLFDIVKTRILTQFNNSPKLLSIFESVYTQLQDGYDMTIKVLEKRDINVATGIWLDNIGHIVGLSRPWEDMDKEKIFTFRGLGGSTSPDKGFLDLGPPQTGGLLQSSQGLTDTPPVPMEDEQFRMLIRAKAAANNRSGNIEDIFSFLEFFADCSFDTSTHGNIIISITDEWVGMRERNFCYEKIPRSAAINVEFINW